MHSALVYLNLFYSTESWGECYMASSHRRGRNKLVKNLFSKFFTSCTIGIYKKLCMLITREVYLLRVTEIIYWTPNCAYFPGITLFLYEKISRYSERNSNDVWVHYLRMDFLKLNFLYTKLTSKPFVYRNLTFGIFSC